MNVKVVKVGGPFIWQTLSLLEIVQSVISMERDSVFQLADHIQKIQLCLEADTSHNDVSCTICSGLPSVRQNLDVSLKFFQSLNEKKLHIIEHLKHIESNLKEQISSVLQHQENFN